MIDGRLYTGITNKLSRRESEHGVEPSTRTTHIFGAGGILYPEPHSDRISAHQRELQIKKWSHAKKTALIQGNYELLNKLAKRKPNEENKFQT
jgi:putative endonuclease